MYMYRAVMLVTMRSSLLALVLLCSVICSASTLQDRNANYHDEQLLAELDLLLPRSTDHNVQVTDIQSINFDIFVHNFHVVHSCYKLKWCMLAFLVGAKNKLMAGRGCRCT